MAEEEFRIIKDFEKYSISNLGRVRNNTTNRILKSVVGTHGYYHLNLSKDGKLYTKLIHKLVAECFIVNPYNKGCVDHIDNNRLNNDIDNLRWVSFQENQMNRKLSSNNTSNYKGVTFNTPMKKWRAQIYINGKNKHLGYFDNIEEAVNARVKKAEELFGEYKNSCEKEITINLNVPVNTKVKLNINIKSKEDQELEELEKELNEIINKK
jgi:hypothetical protein